MINEYLSGLLGDRNAANWLLAFTFILVGVIISLGIHVSKRDKGSDATPYKFSIRFLIRDNFVRFWASIAICFVIVRFGEQISGLRVADVACVFLGLIFDQLFIIAEQWQNKARDVFKTKA